MAASITSGFKFRSDDDFGDDLAALRDGVGAMSVSRSKRMHLIRSTYTAVCLSFGPIEKVFYAFCDVSVREKDWRGKPGL